MQANIYFIKKKVKAQNLLISPKSSTPFVSIKQEEKLSFSFQTVRAFCFIINSLQYAAELPIVFDGFNMALHGFRQTSKCRQ